MGSQAEFALGKAIKELAAANERISELKAECDKWRLSANLMASEKGECVKDWLAEREVSDKLWRELERQKHHSYNPFEPDNQCDNYKRICTALAEVAAIRATHTNIEEADTQLTTKGSN